MPFFSFLRALTFPMRKFAVFRILESPPGKTNANPVLIFRVQIFRAYAAKCINLLCPTANHLP